MFKVFQFFKKRPVFLFSCILSIVCVISSVNFVFHQKWFMVTYSLLGIYLSFGPSLVAYTSDFLNWCSRHPVIDKLSSIISVIAVLVSLVWSLWNNYNFALAYWSGTKNIILTDVLSCLVITFSPLVCIFFDLFVTFKSEYPSSLKISYILITIFISIQAFSLVYMFIYASQPDAFLNVNSTDAFSFYFDFLYFSAMTLLSGSNTIVAVSTIAKAVVFVETFVFSVFICLIIFNIAPAASSSGNDISKLIRAEESRRNNSKPISLVHFFSDKNQETVTIYKELQSTFFEDVFDVEVCIIPQCIDWKVSDKYFAEIYLEDNKIMILTLEPHNKYGIGSLIPFDCFWGLNYRIYISSINDIEEAKEILLDAYFQCICQNE